MLFIGIQTIGPRKGGRCILYNFTARPLRRGGTLFAVAGEAEGGTTALAVLVVVGRLADADGPVTDPVVLLVVVRGGVVVAPANDKTSVRFLWLGQIGRGARTGCPRWRRRRCRERCRATNGSGPGGRGSG